MRTPTPIYKRGLKLVFKIIDNEIHYELFSETKDLPRSFPIESGKYDGNPERIFANHADLQIDIPDGSQPLDPSVMIEKERLK